MEPLVYRPTEAAAILRISRGNLYELIKRGEITALKAGHRVTYVSRAELERYVASLPTVGAA